MLGNAKGVVAATISVLLFHNPVTAMSMTGYAITVCGVVAYSQVPLPVACAPSSLLVPCAASMPGQGRVCLHGNCRVHRPSCCATPL